MFQEIFDVLNHLVTQAERRLIGAAGGLARAIDVGIVHQGFGANTAGTITEELVIPMGQPLLQSSRIVAGADGGIHKNLVISHCLELLLLHQDDILVQAGADNVGVPDTGSPPPLSPACACG